MASSGVRAKVAIFGGGGGGGGLTINGRADNTPSSSKMRLPPTSSAPDTSISNPIKTIATSTNSNTRIARRPVVNDDDTTSTLAPLPPVKPYAPKLTAAAPQTPFQVDFPASATSSPLSTPQRSYADSTSITDLSGHRRIPQTRIPRYNAAQSSRSTTVGSSSDSTLDRLANAADELSRESVYSITSAVVTTANAVNLQRSTVQSRPVRSGIGGPSTASVAPRTASVDKGIGVKTRRKSRESSSGGTERRRPKSSGRNSSTPTTGPSIRVVEPRTSVSSTLGQTEQEANIDNAVPRRAGGNPSVDRSLETGAHAVSHDDSDRLAPRNATRMDRVTSDCPSGEMVRSTSIASTSYEVRNLNSMYAVDPLSDAWGQNSSVASLSVDDDLSSMGALSFSSPNSPVEQRNDGRQSAKQQAGCTASSSPSSAKDVASRRTPPTRFNTHQKQHEDSTLDATSSLDATLVTQSGRRTAMANDSGYGAGSPPPPSKEGMLTELLASMSLVDAQSFQALASLEQVEALKRELARVETRIGDVQHKLKVEMRMRDAADKLRRSGNRKRSATTSTTTPSDSTGNLAASDSASGLARTHQRRLSITSSVAGANAIDAQQAEQDLAAATKRCDQVSRDLMELFGVASKMRRRLLEHHACVLALRVSELEKDATRARSLVKTETIIDGTALNASEQRARMAEQELQQVQDQAAQIEQVLNRERERHEADKRQLRQTHEQHSKELMRKHQVALEEQQTSLAEHQSALTDATAKLRSVGEQRNDALKAERTRAAELQQRLNAQTEELAERENSYRELQAQMAQLEFETTAERNIMLDRQKLFSAFEHRLERAEKRLREQDDRCARMLGKAEGREEMDDLLNQIKYGSNNADSKKNKTAGQDIDGLIDSLTTHIDDVEDELQRVAGMRSMDEQDSEYGAGQRAEHDAGVVRELTVELQSSRREAEEWRTLAESAKRQLAAVQRQSALSMTSTNAGGQLGMSSLGWGNQSNAGGGFRTRMNSARSAAELEARVALLEKRNAALEAELVHVRDDENVRGGLVSSSESGVIGGEDTSMTSMRHKVAGSMAGVGESIYAQTVHALLDILPSLSDEVEDLHELQEILEVAPNNDQLSYSNGAQQLCKVVEERARKTMFVSRSLVGKALAMAMERRDLDEELNIVTQEREDAKAALEDLRSGHASQMQVIEAGKSREQQLNTKVHQLEQRLTDMRHTIESNMMAASNKSQTLQKPAAACLSAVNTTGMRTSRSLGSLSGAGASSSNSSSMASTATRRGVVPIVAPRSVSASTSSKAAAVRSAATNASFTLAPLTSPTSSKLSFTSSSALNTTSTPTTSFPTLSPSIANNKEMSVSGSDFGRRAAVGGITSRSPSLSARLQADHRCGNQKAQIEDAQSVRSVSGGGGGAGVIDQSSHVDPNVPAAGTPRSMMLGMGTPQMMHRIRQLEAELLQSKLHVQRVKTDQEQRMLVEQQLHECRAELADHRREWDDIRNVESRQRIELMEELTTLTSELSEARAQLRLRQQAASSSVGRPSLQNALQQKVLNI